MFNSYYLNLNYKLHFILKIYEIFYIYYFFSIKKKKNE